MSLPPDSLSIASNAGPTSPYVTQIAGVAVPALAERFGTPCYVYDAAMIRQRIADLAPFDTVRYAQKANSNLSVLRLVRGAGVLVDAVSAGEIARALAAGYQPGPGDHAAGQPAEIIYTADIFDRASLDAVIEHDLAVNCGSPDMIDQYGARCQPLGRKRGVTLRINPGFGHGHSQKVNTGGEGSKHGVWHEQIEMCVERAARYGLTVEGLHMHIGSGTDMEHLGRVADAMQAFALRVGPSVHAISAGGGLSTPYRGNEPPVDVAAYYSLWDATRRRLAEAWGHAVALEIEPGRYLAAESGSLVTEVRAVKQMGTKEYILVDAGFNNLVRPAMYGAYHPLAVCPAEGVPQPSAALASFVVAGPLCESGDIFTQKEGGYVEERSLVRPRVGDYLVIGAVGAYGYTMASNYNSKPLVAEVLIDGGEPRLIRAAQTPADLLRGETSESSRD
ncbi:diaminopimelate decarboxylase [Botrimarina hoheduenensis]|uniref:Diaminopimelate decarboxylase n=1 Tax=Botrimarina hoheduenensis TaxID=2528000 RepID=A0A5C5W8Q8_9BACT|nr:diaminopimelate decarboxylase [Botrimarina hoheduenensis]TWT46419.1 Diaminopimelate decarboxylase [Botrimarina hoheduenensis]